MNKGIGNRTPTGTVSTESPQLMAKAGHWETEKAAAEALSERSEDGSQETYRSAEVSALAGIL